MEVGLLPKATHTEFSREKSICHLRQREKELTQQLEKKRDQLSQVLTLKLLEMKEH
jgi:hypothetical protein